MQNTFCTHKENSSVNNRKKKMQGHRTKDKGQITNYKLQITNHTEGNIYIIFSVSNMHKKNTFYTATSNHFKKGCTASYRG